MHCWLNDKEICKTPSTSNCFTERTEDNKCCGHCASSTCNKCYTHRCNNEKDYDYFCRRKIGIDNICKNSSCYIANLEEMDKDGLFRIISRWFNSITNLIEFNSITNLRIVVTLRYM
uniref:Uncharacterized protein n=1 Tax=Meloidogyne incognita TaxID=6306 RepID=A0A914MAU8_MELIC